MQEHLILDKLSEFLMVEQAGIALYRVAAARAVTPALRDTYDEFGRQTAHHQQVLVQLVTQLGGDPDYVSPTARLAQYKGDGLLDSGMQVDGLSASEIEANDLENVLLAEVRAYAGWDLLEQLAQQASGQLQSAVQAALEEVQEQAYQHLTWARDMLTELCFQAIDEQKSPGSTLRRSVVSGPQPGIEAFHPAPYTDGLLEGARQPVWIESRVGTRR